MVKPTLVVRDEVVSAEPRTILECEKQHLMTKVNKMNRLSIRRQLDRDDDQRTK